MKFEHAVRLFHGYTQCRGARDPRLRFRGQAKLTLIRLERAGQEREEFLLKRK